MLFAAIDFQFSARVPQPATGPRGLYSNDCAPRGGVVEAMPSERRNNQLGGVDDVVDGVTDKKKGGRCRRCGDWIAAATASIRTITFRRQRSSSYQSLNHVQGHQQHCPVTVTKKLNFWSVRTMAMAVF